MTTALDDARHHYRNGDNLFRAGVKIRIAAIFREDSKLDMDSVFVKAVAAEVRRDPLP